MNWINDVQIECIKEFCCGLFAGIHLAGKTREEVFGDDWWMNWNVGIEVNVWLDGEDWRVTAYKIDSDGIVDQNDYLRIDIGGLWK